MEYPEQKHFSKVAQHLYLERENWQRKQTTLVNILYNIRGNKALIPLHILPFTFNKNSVIHRSL